MKKKRCIVNLVLIAFFLLGNPVYAKTTTEGTDPLQMILNLFTLFSGVIPSKIELPENRTGSGTSGESDSTGGGSGERYYNPNVVFYCQGDPQWQTRFDLGSNGCGPTSVAIVLNSFGVNKNPAEVANAMYPNYFTGGLSKMKPMLDNKRIPAPGFQIGPDLAQRGVLDTNRAKEYIQQGYLLIASSERFPCTPYGCKPGKLTVNHIFVVDGISDDYQTVSIRDPSNCQYGKINSIEDPNYRNRGTSSFDWFYAFPVKRIQ
ncbi:C39 family peptidase [Candidatus Roizmanbacteria bacterium]|nr:C39 family peptidase [Candidatus Roizmanbacteria bacterium]